MSRKHPRSMILHKGLACFTSAARGGGDHYLTSQDYPDELVHRFAFEAGGGLKWNISALMTPRETAAPWKIVVITGAPSWAEYWAPAMAALPSDREMVVVDRPGYGRSEPGVIVRDIRVQAAALAPLLDAPKGQKVLLVGQSYGAAIASVMAADNPRKVAGLVLLSGYFGEPGPTARRLIEAGRRMSRLIPRDLRTAVEEVSGQPVQLVHARAALNRLRLPVHIIHGDQDDFAPLDIAEKLTAEVKARRLVRFERVPGANHFMAEGPVEVLVDAIERCIPRAQSKPGLWSHAGKALRSAKTVAGAVALAFPGARPRAIRAEGDRIAVG